MEVLDTRCDGSYADRQRPAYRRSRRRCPFLSKGIGTSRLCWHRPPSRRPGAPMHRRWHRRALAAAALLLTTTGAATGAVTAHAPPALAAPPPQEPGVTLRVFDVQTALSKLCTL